RTCCLSRLPGPERRPRGHAASARRRPPRPAASRRGRAGEPDRGGDGHRRADRLVPAPPGRRAGRRRAGGDGRRRGRPRRGGGAARTVGRGCAGAPGGLRRRRPGPTGPVRRLHRRVPSPPHARLARAGYVGPTLGAGKGVTMASAQAEAVKDMLRQFGAAEADPSVTVDQLRANGAMFGELTTEPDGVTYEEVDADGVPAMWVVPDGAAQDRVLQYVHGGGYVICSAATHRRLVGHIAKAADIRALNVDYRLAPEHPHPAAVDDSVTAYRWLLAQGMQPEHLAIAGDSAGGGLTIATLVALRDLGVPLPAAAVPISPWVDLEGTGESMTTRAHVDLL